MQKNKKKNSPGPSTADRSVQLLARGRSPQVVAMSKPFGSKGRPFGGKSSTQQADAFRNDHQALQQSQETSQPPPEVCLCADTPHHQQCAYSGVSSAKIKPGPLSKKAKSERYVSMYLIMSPASHCRSWILPFTWEWIPERTQSSCGWQRNVWHQSYLRAGANTQAQEETFTSTIGE